MNQAELELPSARRSLSHFVVLFCLSLGIFLVFAGPASAAFQFVGSFGTKATSLPTIENPTGIAVNYTGAGGVPAGTIYAVNRIQAGSEPGGLVLSYDSHGGFREAWGWGVANEEQVFQRCGPEGELAHPTCKATGASTQSVAFQGEGVGELSKPEGIAIDEVTGNVYVFNRKRAAGAVQIFTAIGEPVGSFGENELNEGEGKITETPEKFHPTSFRSRIAVDESGTVYVGDLKNRTGGSESRVMVFKPQIPGDPTSYAYTGHANDIGFSASLTYTFGTVAVDIAGDVYLANSEFVSEFAPGELTTPACRYKLPGAQLAGMTVDPLTGELFVASFSTPKKIRRVGPCEEGKFGAEEPDFALRQSELVAEYALAFDPSVRYEPSRPEGILYFGGQNQVGEWDIEMFAPAEVHSPNIDSESVSAVGATSAALQATIDPNGSQTRYSFQYLTAAAFEANEPADPFAGAIEVPLGGSLLSSTQTPSSVSAPISGLQPGTQYVFRVIATSRCNPEHPEVPCEEAGAPQRFRTFGLESGLLPDDRAYELVSPADKAGGQVYQLEPELGCVECNLLESSTFPRQASADGEAIVYEGTPFATSGGGSRENEYLARHTPAGWQTVNLTPEHLVTSGNESGFRAFDTALSRGLIVQTSPPLTSTAPSGFANLYGLSTADPSNLSPVLLEEAINRPPGEEKESLKVIYAGSSAGMSHVIFEVNEAYPVESSGPQGTNLYDEANGSLDLVNVLPGNTGTVPGATFGAGSLYHPGSSDRGLQEYAFDHAISEDGSRIFWSAPSGQVYVREDGEVTREIPDHTGKYLTAAADGSKVLLSDGMVFDLEAEELESEAAKTDLTDGEGGFEGLVGQSEDMSSIYFVDKKALAGANAEGKVPNEGGGEEDNLYLYRAGVTTFIATLAARHNLEGGDNETLGRGGTVGDWKEAAGYRTAEASPDGRYLAFMSRAPLTGGDNVGSTCGPHEEAARCEGVFLYDSEAGHLVCPSCNPSEQAPVGNSSVPMNSVGNLLGSFFRLPQRYLTNSGRLYFNSKDSLSPFDTNQDFLDVYQYEPQGVGTCAQLGGCVSLISPGTEASDSMFYDTDESGKNVFFTTRDRLVPNDHDEVVDLYDAREGGGGAGEGEGTATECSGEACQATSVPPAEGIPGSSSTPAGGNAVEPPAKACPKGKVRKSGKCVAKHKQKKAKGTKHHKANKGHARRSKSDRRADR